MDERAWAAYRKLLRTRVGRQMALIIGPFVAFVAVLSILAPMDYPAGDIRNSIEFRLVFYGGFIAFDVLGMIVSARWLLADRRL